MQRKSIGKINTVGDTPKAAWVQDHSSSHPQNIHSVEQQQVKKAMIFAVVEIGSTPPPPVNKGTSACHIHREEITSETGTGGSHHGYISRHGDGGWCQFNDRKNVLFFIQSCFIIHRLVNMVNYPTQMSINFFLL
jgi:hypothetical protein